ncbi:MAG: pseudouridine synthase [Chloroflexota bacterium]
MSTERLQKILAAAGFGSRRSCEEMVIAGRVRVNGKVAKLGDKADLAADAVTLDGEPIAPEKLTYVLLYKPRGVVSSLDAQGDRRTVRDLVPLSQRLYPVGRLDALSEGLILLTNDGDLTNRLTHPRYGHDKEYRISVLGNVDQESLNAWQRGVVIEDENGKRERTAPAKVDVLERSGEGTWLRVIMREGKKHEIRRIAQSLGLHVARLIRVRMGGLVIGALKSGEWRHLTSEELRALMSETGAKTNFKSQKTKDQISKTPNPKSQIPREASKISKPQTSKFRR